MIQKVQKTVAVPQTQACQMQHDSSGQGEAWDRLPEAQRPELDAVSRVPSQRIEEFSHLEALSFHIWRNHV